MFNKNQKKMQIITKFELDKGLFKENRVLMVIGCDVDIAPNDHIYINSKGEQKPVKVITVTTKTVNNKGTTYIEKTILCQ